MNSVVSFLSSFVFSLHLVMNPWRLGGIVQVSFCFILVCVAGLFTISKGVFPPSWGIRIEEGEEENKKGRYFSILKTGGGLTIREAALVLFFFSKRPTGWMVLVSSNTGFTEFLHVLPRGIVLWKIKCPSNQEEAGTVSIPFPPCFLKGLKKEPFVFFSRKVALKVICVVFTASSVSVIGSCRLCKTMLSDAQPQRSKQRVGKRFKPFLSLSLIFLRNRDFATSLPDQISPPHATEAPQGQDLWPSFPTFSSALQTLKYLLGKLIWNFILMGFMNKSPS